MRRSRHDDDDRILQDGERLRVPLTLMDGVDPVQRSVARSSVRVTDGNGATAGLHRPGFRLPANDARKITRRNARGEEEGVYEEEEEHGSERQTSDAIRARDAAYREHEKYLNDAWKNPLGFGGDPSIIGFGERGNARGQREGDICTIDGWPGHLHNINRTLQCVADRADAAQEGVQEAIRDHQQHMNDEYASYDNWLREQWRRG